MLGDIVLGIWPEIVIDQMFEAPEAVLSSCVADAIVSCFFGYSKYGKQRVLPLSFHFSQFIIMASSFFISISTYNIFIAFFFKI